MLNKIFLALLVLALLAPAGLAHTPPGPKNFCESPPDWSTHDYWTQGGVGRVILGPYDGNGTSCSHTSIVPEYDGHLEFAIGGAYLAADNGGVYASGPWAGASWGSQACFGEDADHTPMTTIYITDLVTGGSVGMDITSDYARDAVPADTDPTTGAQTICGDHLVEPCDPTDPTAVDQVTCNSHDGDLTVMTSTTLWDANPNSGTPTFGPGQDGAYVIFVFANVNSAHPGGPLAGHIFN